MNEQQKEVGMEKHPRKTPGYDDSLLATYKEIQDALSLTVKLDHSQVDTIIVAALMDKYKGQVRIGNKEWGEAFEKVLRFYLSADELTKLLAA